MTIRKMKADDYSQVYRLWLSCEGMGLYSGDDSEYGISMFLKCNPDTCFVAETDGKIVGVILVGTDGRRGYIYHTAVDINYRRMGIGKRLVCAAMDSLKSMNIAKAALVVFSENEQGNAFWEKMGFYVRNDLIYRDKALVEMTRIHT